MSIGKRIARMIRAWRGRDASDVTSLKASLDDIHRSQLGQLQNMRRSVADIATSRKRVELRLGGLRQQLDELDAEARQAVAAGDDDAARTALARRVALEKSESDLAERHAALEADERKLDAIAFDLQAQIEDRRLRKDTLSARYTAATARTEITSASRGIASQMSEVGQAVAAAERRTRELEARADAVDELVADGVITRSDEDEAKAFDRRLAALSDASEVDRRLDAIAHPPNGDARGQDQVQK